MAAVLQDGTETQGISYQEGWGDILQKHRQWRCHVCADHTGEHADLSIGDPWDRPAKDLNEKGRSLIIVRSEAGRSFLHSAIKAGVLTATRRENNAVALAQPNLSATRRILFGRLAGLWLMGLAAPAYPNYRLPQLWFKHVGRREKLASILGTIRRAARKRLWRPEVAAR
jgi:coenzyme F420 hydrogenase subunit beta